MSIRVAFDQLNFSSSYQRNNKAKGRKNLRCFPLCKHTGHSSDSYCGRAVSVTVYVESGFAENLELYPFAKFCTYDAYNGVEVEPKGSSASAMANQTSGQPGPHVPDQFPSEQILALQKSEHYRNQMENLWIPGTFTSRGVDEATQQHTFTFTFNKKNHGWHYSWQSHSNQRKTEHTLHVFILGRLAGQERMVCVAEICTPPFTIHGRRKRDRAVDDGSECGSEQGSPKTATPESRIRRLVPANGGNEYSKYHYSFRNPKSPEDLEDYESPVAPTRSLVAPSPKAVTRTIAADKMQQPSLSLSPIIATTRRLNISRPQGQATQAPILQANQRNNFFPANTVVKQERKNPFAGPSGHCAHSAHSSGHIAGSLNGRIGSGGTGQMVGGTDAFRPSQASLNKVSASLMKTVVKTGEGPPPPDMAQQPTSTDFAAMNDNILERLKVLEARRQQLIYQQSLIEQSEAAAKVKKEPVKKEPAPSTIELTSDWADCGEQGAWDACEAEAFGIVNQTGDDLIFTDLAADGILDC
jgi:hypothetical protein